jgi:diaminopimelate decarboxylase
MAEEVLQAVLSDKAAKAAVDRFSIRFALQPGRSLVDQCGISLFSVIGAKPTGREVSVMVLDGMSFSISERWFGSDFIPAPFLLGRDGLLPCSSAEFALVGRSCLENDIIRQSAVGFSRAPVDGDAIVFVNTAGYQMDSNESEFHSLPLPHKIAVTKDRGRWRCILDEQYVRRPMQ